MKKKLTSLLLCLALLLCCGAPAAAGGIRYVVTGEKANVLPQPDAEEYPIAVLPGGSVVEVAETRNGFGKVTQKSSGVTGWVHMSLLRFAGGEAENPTGVLRIFVSRLPDKTVYTENEEEFDPAGLEISAEYGDGAAPVTGYALYAPGFGVYGEKTVYVSYTAPGGAVFTTEFAVTVAKVPVEALELISPPAKTNYIEGEKLELNGLRVRLTYTDGRPARELTAEEILSDPDFSLLGCHSEAQGGAVPYGAHVLRLYYKYPEINCAFTLNAVRRQLVSLDIATPPDSLTVYSNTALPDLTGLTLNAYYDNGEHVVVPYYRCTAVCDPASFVLGPGNYVKVEFETLFVMLEFTYALDGAETLTVLTPRVLNFIMGEKIDLSALKVYLTSASGARTEIFDYTVSAVDPAVKGPQTVSITYKEYAEIFTINISPYYQRGDANGDGEVTAEDARLALRASVKLYNPTGENPRNAADADRDGEITSADARLILRAAVKLESIISFENLVILPHREGAK